MHARAYRRCCDQRGDRSSQISAALRQFTKSRSMSSRFACEQIPQFFEWRPILTSCRDGVWLATVCWDIRSPLASCPRRIESTRADCERGARRSCSTVESPKSVFIVASTLLLPTARRLTDVPACLDSDLSCVDSSLHIPSSAPRRESTRVDSEGHTTHCPNRIRVPSMYPTHAVLAILTNLARREMNKFRTFNTPFSSIPTAPTIPTCFGSINWCAPASLLIVIQCLLGLLHVHERKPKNIKRLRGTIRTF
jgi:hypothetical protein